MGFFEDEAARFGVKYGEHMREAWPAVHMLLDDLRHVKRALDAVPSGYNHGLVARELERSKGFTDDLLRCVKEIKAILKGINGDSE